MFDVFLIYNLRVGVIEVEIIDINFMVIFYLFFSIRILIWFVVLYV